MHKVMDSQTRMHTCMHDDMHTAALASTTKICRTPHALEEFYSTRLQVFWVSDVVTLRAECGGFVPTTSISAVCMPLGGKGSPHPTYRGVPYKSGRLMPQLRSGLCRWCRVMPTLCVSVCERDVLPVPPAPRMAGRP